MRGKRVFVSRTLRRWNDDAHRRKPATGMSEHFYFQALRRAVHFSNGEFVDLVAAFAALAQREPASAARDAVTAYFGTERHGGFDLEAPPEAVASPERLRVLVDVVAALARELALPVDASTARFDPWGTDRQAQWLARLSQMHEVLLATAAARGLALDTLALDLPPVLAQDVRAYRLGMTLDDLERSHRRGPWDGLQHEVRRAATELIAVALAPPGLARERAVLLHAYQRLAESCEALGDDAAAAGAWRSAAAYAPAGPYRTSLIDCADEAAQAAAHAGS